MANTYTSLYYHIIFSTKNRVNCIKQEIEADIWKYIAGIAWDNHIKAIDIGGIDNHIHILLSLPTTMSLSLAMQRIKGGSSKWIHERFPDLWHFSWQDGYGAFTVSKSNLSVVSDYIHNQRQHHQLKCFEDEYIELLNKHEIQYDDRYLLG